MKQSEARKLAKAVTEGTGLIHVADTVRETITGSLVRGGYSHRDQFWVVFAVNSNRIVYPIELRNREAFPAPSDFESKLRETEKDIAARIAAGDPEIGLTAARWEQIRQWPGEFHGSADDAGHDEWCAADCDEQHRRQCGQCGRTNGHTPGCAVGRSLAARGGDHTSQDRRAGSQ